MCQTTKLITNMIILALALATIVQASTPQQWQCSGVEVKQPNSACPTWFLHYSVLDEHFTTYLKGYFQLNGCFGEDFSVSDGFFVLHVKHTGNSVLTEISSGVELTGNLGAFTPVTDDVGNSVSCWTGGGPNVIPESEYCAR